MRWTIRNLQPPRRTAIRAMSWTLGAMATAALAPVSLAANPEEVLKATPAIVDTAHQICAAVSDAGSSQSAKVSGEVEAGLKGLFRKLITLGVSAQGERDTSHYQGVLQGDLSTALKDQNECRTRVFYKMIETLFPDTTGTVQATYAGYQPTGDFETELRYFLEVTGTRKTLKVMLDGVAQNMEKQLRTEFPNDPGKISQFGKIFREEMPRFDDIVDLILPIYAKHFNISQMQELNKFYSTPVMREMIHDMPLVMEEAIPIELQIGQKMQYRLEKRLKEWEESQNQQVSPR